MFKIIADSCCDLSDNILKQHDIEMIPFYTTLDGTNYLRERVDISVADFYKRLKNEKVFPKTSFPPVQDYVNIFRQYLELQQDVLYISMSSKLSGAYQAAMNVSENLKDEYPNNKVFVFDSKQVSLAEGLLVLHAAKLRDEGLSLSETLDALQKMKTNLFATVDSLEYLQRGGRIGKVSAIAGNLLNIKPIISMDDGELISCGKIRGRRKAIDEIVSLTFQYASRKAKCAVFHSEAYDEAMMLKQILVEQYELQIDLPIMDVGAVIGSHIGPSLIATALIK